MTEQEPEVEYIEDHGDPVIPFENPLDLTAKQEKKVFNTLDELLKEREGL